MDLFIYTAAALLLGGGVAYWKLFLKHELYLEGLCLGVPGGTYRRHAAGLYPFGKRTYQYDSRFQGRGFSTEYRYRLFVQLQSPASDRHFSWKVNDDLEIQFPVAQKFWLRVLAKRVEEPSEDRLLIGDPELDQAFMVHTNQPEAAREFLRGNLVRNQLRRLPSNCEHLEIYRGWLKLLIQKPVSSGFRRSDFENMLELLALLAADYTQRGSEFGVAIMESNSACPYCRGELSAGEDPVVECRLCSTRLHRACWDENGQCTTWGCTSSDHT